MMSSGLLVAHNAPFDLSVLGKCLLDYRAAWHPTARYACTCQMGRRLLPELPNHKLNTISDYLGLELDHHHAGSDSRACAEILLYYLAGGADMSQRIPASVDAASETDLKATRTGQTKWTSSAAKAMPNKVALHRTDDGELLGMMSYEIDHGA